MILKGKWRLCQLAGIDTAEMVTPFTNDEIDSLWAEHECWQITQSNFLERLTTNVPKAKQFIL